MMILFGWGKVTFSPPPGRFFFPVNA